MPRTRFPFAIVVTSAVATATAQPSAPASSGVTSSASTSSTVSSSSSDGHHEVTMSGTGTVAELAGDRIEIRDGAVYVNGTSFGPARAGAVVKYTVGPDGRTLRVDGERRTAAK